MESLWNPQDAAPFEDKPLELRVYTSRLLGRESDLVLHGGGNTSVKDWARDLFGNRIEVLFVKGSGWDLATIEAAGFAPVRLDVLRAMAELDTLTDTEMVRAQRAAMTDPDAPNPSVEAILHGIIPFPYVDHTHADAVVTVTNSPGGEARVKEIYGERVLVVPYVMPGFLLAKTVHEMTRELDWSSVEGMILLSHGVFTFADDARQSYEKMIALVSEAEDYLQAHGASSAPPRNSSDVDAVNPEPLAAARRAVSDARGAAVLARVNGGPEARAFAARADVASVAARGPLTPDHVIRTKRTAMILDGDPAAAVERFVEDYRTYFERHRTDAHVCLDPAPRWAVWKGVGTVAFGRTARETGILADIVAHTIPAIAAAETLGGWRALPESDIFEVEYWELEQAKLAGAKAAPALQGKIALVTGAASGIGEACAEALLAEGAVVAALDVNPVVSDALRAGKGPIFACDVTDTEQVARAVRATVREFGGLDIVISNAGVFPPSMTIEDMGEAAWARSLELNLTSHRRLLQTCLPFLKRGVDPAVVFIGSKNVPAPGPGASAYSVAKAGLAQLARVAALELGEHGVRVNTIHPNAVFDTALWTDDVIAVRAKAYGLTPEQYRTHNVLRTEVRSADVAAMAVAMVGAPFARTTGAQVPVDGGNERVI